MGKKLIGKKMMGWLPIASKIASTKSKLIMVAALLILVIILIGLVREASWHHYIQEVQTDPEKTAVAFAKALGRNDLNTLEMLMADELRDDLATILNNEPWEYRCHNLDFSNYSDPNTIRSWTNPPGYYNGVRLRETFNDGHTISYSMAYLYGPMFARYSIAFWDLEVTVQKQRWVISKKWSLLCNHQFYNGCGP